MNNTNLPSGKIPHKPTVLFIFFQTDNRSNGGVNSLVQLINNFHSIRAVILTQKESDVTRRLAESKFPVFIWKLKPGNGRIVKFFNIVLFNVKVYLLLRKQEFDAVHINDIRALYHSIFALRLKRLKTIFNLRDVFEPGKKYGLGWRFLNLCQDIVVLSNEMREELLQRLPLTDVHYWKQHLHAIYSIVNLDLFKPVETSEMEALRKQLNFNATSNAHLIYVGAFNEKKNQHIFIRQALPDFASQNYHVHFVGDDDTPYGQRCKQLVQQLNLQHACTFHGYQEAIDKFYKAADVTIVPTRREGLARCMIESLACGTPVVSFDVCSAREILQANGCGIVLPGGDYRRLLKAIERVLENREQLSRNACNTARTFFNAKQIVPQFIEVYK